MVAAGVALKLPIRPSQRSDVVRKKVRNLRGNTPLIIDLVSVESMSMSDKYGDRTYHEPTPAERDTMLAVLAEHSRLERIADLTGAMATMTDDCYQEHESIGLRCVGQRD